VLHDTRGPRVDTQTGLIENDYNNQNAYNRYAVAPHSVPIDGRESHLSPEMIVDMKADTWTDPKADEEVVAKDPSLWQKLGATACCACSSSPVSSAPTTVMARRQSEEEPEEFPLEPRVVSYSSTHKPHSSDEPVDIRVSQMLQSSQEPVDFRGTWLLTEFEGDMEAFMSAMGASYFVRKTASMLSFGIGMAKITIQQDGNHIFFDHGFYQQDLNIGAGAQTSNYGGGPAQVTPSWEGRALLLEVCMPNGKETCRRWFFMEGGCLIVKSRSSSGVEIRQSYSVAAD